MTSKCLEHLQLTVGEKIPDLSILLGNFVLLGLYPLGYFNLFAPGIIIDIQGDWPVKKDKIKTTAFSNFD